MEKKRAGVYVRVSTDDQATSVENQIAQGKEYIRRQSEFHSDDIKVYIDEAVSGYYTSVFDRKDMKEAVNDAKNKNISMIVFKEISRVGRDKQENPAIVGIFEQYGVRVIGLNDNYDTLHKDSLTLDILSIMSEQESVKTSIRVSSARRQKALRGQWGGEAPIGYKVDKITKKLIVDENTKNIIVNIFDNYVNKGWGTFKIAQYLNNNNIKTKNGNKWSRKSISGIIKNEAYIGNVLYGTRKNKLKRTYDDTGKMTKKKIQLKIPSDDWLKIEKAHEAIIDEIIFYKAQEIINSKASNKSSKRAYHPLTGVLFCYKCGQGMVCQKRTFNNKEYRYYICKTYHKYGRDECSQANINADVLEKEIINIIQKKLNNFSLENIKILINNDVESETLKKNILEKNNGIKKLIKDQGDLFEQRELFTNEVYKIQMNTMKNKIENFQKEIDILTQQKLILNQQLIDNQYLNDLLDKVKDLQNRSVSEIRTIIHELIKKIIVKDNELIIEYNYDI